MGQTYEKGSAEAVVKKQNTAAFMIVDLNACRQANLLLPLDERPNPRFVPTYNPNNRSHLIRSSVHIGPTRPSKHFTPDPCRSSLKLFLFQQIGFASDPKNFQ